MSYTMKPYVPERHIREDEITRNPKLISLTTRYVTPLDKAVNAEVRKIEKERRRQREQE